MDKGDLVKCWSIDHWDRVGLVLEHDQLLKTVKVFFYDKSETKVLYSRDVQLYKRCPNNKRKLKQKTLDNDDKSQYINNVRSGGAYQPLVILRGQL